MKKRVYYLLLSLATIFVTSCYDDDELWDKVNSLDNRLTNIESQLTQMNSNINAMSSIVSTLEGYTYIKEVTPTTDGYIIKFSDGKTATITNGKNGQNAPVIGFDKDTDGEYYWTQTIDGNQTWLTDAYGNKVPVTGKTPLLKVSTDGYWMVSYDNGVTYMNVLDANGNPVQAVGQDGTDGADGADGADGSDGTDGDSWFESVTYDPTTGILTLVIDGETIELTVGDAATGVPSDKQAGVPPTVTDEEKTFEMPTSISTMSVDPNNPKVGRFNLAGINTNGEWLELYGTGSEEQNVWVEINGVQKGIKVINGDEVTTRSRSGWVAKAKADIIFLVDNSGSMGQEANKVAEEIIRWSEKLSKTMDVQFGCVGIDHNYINGALNITDVNTLSAYLNEYTGTQRTKHYGQNMDTAPADWETLKTKAANYNNAGGECGGIMLHYADENFTFREGANRFYVYFTDEPNQPGGQSPWSVLTVKNDSEYYNWSSNKGVIYTVFSSTDNHSSWQNWLRNEDPCLFSTYTGGQIIETNSSFNISLDELPVTGAITQSFIFTFNITPDLKVGGVYDITIIIKSKDGKVISKFTYKGVKFE